jgi:hypothetical protein
VVEWLRWGLLWCCWSPVSFWMVFGSDDAALRAAAEPHISRMVESNSFRTIFIVMFVTLFTTDFLSGRYASFS